MLTPADRPSRRAPIALFILAAVFIVLGLVLNRLEDADRRGEQTEYCRTHGVDDGWQCVPVEGK